MPFLTKDLSKAIMKILNLTNNYLKKTNRTLHKKQRN